MWRAEIMTPWIGTGASTDANRPKLSDDYVIGFEDVTGQPTGNLHPAPNLYIVQVECDAAMLNAIEADADYLVLWSEEIV